MRTISNTGVTVTYWAAVGKHGDRTVSPAIFQSANEARGHAVSVICQVTGMPDFVAEALADEGFDFMPVDVTLPEGATPFNLEEARANIASFGLDFAA